MPNPSRPIVIALVLFVSGGLAACADVSPETARRAWLINTLIEDNRVHIERDPELVAGKLALMASDPYAYFRGSLGQYRRDVAEAGGLDASTAYGSAASSLVLLAGDPHPENIGTYLTSGGELIVELDDFDAATYGPYFFDVRRLALGFWVGGAVLTDQVAAGDDLGQRAARAVASGYAAEIRDLDAGKTPFAMAASQNPINQHLVEHAREDGDARGQLGEYTEMVEGARQMVYGELEPPAGSVISKVVAEVSESERRAVTAALADYPDTVADPAALGGAPRLKAIGRRLGAGVASYPLLRFYVLLEGPTGAADDDVLLELKETGDATTFDPSPVFPARRFANNGDRSVTLQRALQRRDDADPYLGWGSSGDLALRVRQLTGYQRHFKISKIAEKIAEGDWSGDDYVDLAELAGRLLARSHALAPAATGEPGLAAIAAAIGGDDEGFVAETESHVAAYGPILLADRERLAELLDRRGPLLGARR